MMNRDRLVYLFSKLRNKLEAKNKFSNLSESIIQNIKDAYFFNQFKTIVIYNDIDSISLNPILTDGSSYAKNAFVFPKLNNWEVEFRHVSGPEKLIISDFGVEDVSSECFKIDMREIDVILVSGLALDYQGNWLHDEDNTILYNDVFKKINKLTIGVSLEYQIYRQNLPSSNRQMDGFLTEEGLYSVIEIPGV